MVTVINYRGDFMEEKILEFIRVDDVPQGCKDLVEIFGMDTFIIMEFPSCMLRTLVV